MSLWAGKLVVQTCKTATERGASLSFIFKYFPLLLTVLRDRGGVSPSILELEGTEPQENDQGIGPALFIH